MRFTEEKKALRVLKKREGDCGPLRKHHRRWLQKGVGRRVWEGRGGAALGQNELPHMEKTEKRITR